MKVTLEQVMSAVKNDDMTGFCTKCGAEHSNIEPDAHNYTCEECGSHTVYGAEELLFMLA